MIYVSSFAPGPEGGIQAYRLDETTGRLTPLKKTGGLEHPFFMAVTRDRRRLYAIQAPQFGGKDSEHVAAFAVTGAEGELTPLNRQSTRGSASCYLELDATGRSLLVANYSTGSVASLPVRADGSLDPIRSFHQHAGGSVNRDRQEGPHAHAIVVTPDNRHALAADLGLDQVLCYRLDARSGALEPARRKFARTLPGAGPRHLAFHPNGRHLYAINELANSVTHFEFEAGPAELIERATLSTLPEGFGGTSYCADLKLTPDGRFLYGTNRGHDSIAVYRVAADGALTRVAIHPSLGKGPQNLLVAANGRLLLCANMPGSNLAVFRIDPENGTLTSAGEPISIRLPSCIR